MYIIDTKLQELAKQGKSIRIGQVGAGFMGRAVAREIIKYSPGLRLVGVANRNIDKVDQLYKEADVNEYKKVSSLSELENSIKNGSYAALDDAMLLCQSKEIDVIFEITGNVEFGAKVALEAIKNGKHILTMNAELGGTLGPILKVYADKAGVIYSDSDGDQPGVTMNLYRFVKQIGLKPVVCGSIKGLQDPYRTPETQLNFAKKWGQNLEMVTSFADGTKISFEQCIVANATGMKVAKRGMYGFTLEAGKSFEEAMKLYPAEELIKGSGIVDYLAGATPGPGIFVFAATEDTTQKKMLNLYKLGEGPFYPFYTPYHLCHFEVPISIARVALFKDPVITPLNRPVVEVIATAKKDLKAGETLDGIGGFMMYGVCENSDIARKENLLPIGLAGGAKIKKDISKDKQLTFDDIELPTDRLCDRLWKEQYKYFKNKN